MERESHFFKLAPHQPRLSSRRCGPEKERLWLYQADGVWNPTRPTPCCLDQVEGGDRCRTCSTGFAEDEGGCTAHVRC